MDVTRYGKDVPPDSQTYSRATAHVHGDTYTVRRINGGTFDADYGDEAIAERVAAEIDRNERSGRYTTYDDLRERYSLTEADLGRVLDAFEQLEEIKFVRKMIGEREARAGEFADDVARRHAKLQAAGRYMSYDQIAAELDAQPKPVQQYRREARMGDSLPARVAAKAELYAKAGVHKSYDAIVSELQ